MHTRNPSIASRLRSAGLAAAATLCSGGLAGHTGAAAKVDVRRSQTAAAPSPVVLTFSTVGDSRQDPAAWAGWTLSNGVYWVGIQIGAADSLGSGSATGALVDVGAPNPVARTAFDAGNGYEVTAQALTFGLRVDVVAVPEPGAGLLALAGLAAVGWGWRAWQRLAGAGAASVPNRSPADPDRRAERRPAGAVPRRKAPLPTHAAVTRRRGRRQ